MTEIPYPYLQFIGATQTVTGSKTVVTTGPNLNDRVMIDCGLFQGPKKLRLRNRALLPVDPNSIGSVLITHGHLDHCGYLPRLVADGFSGRVYCTAATMDLMRLILLDSAHLQEEEAKYANKAGYTRHRPALPLYTTEDALSALKLLRPVELKETIQIGDKIRASFHEAGHILGSTSIHLELGMNPVKTVVFSGDLGRYGAPILPDPDSPPTPDWVVLESTYGGRYHSDTDPSADLAAVVNESVKRGGTLLIPAFAIGRTQSILYALRQLQDNGDIPKIPVYIDSPMAIRATRALDRHESSLDDETRYLKRVGAHPCHPHNLHIFRSVEQSKSLNKVQREAIIISASGMVTGGRILHHMKLRLPHPEHTILFIGYQAYGTRGRTIQEGRDRIKIHGQQIPVKAQISSINGFSAHADQDELITWLRKFDTLPGGVLLNHGEEKSLQAQKQKIQEILDIPVEVPEYMDKFTLAD